MVLENARVKVQKISRSQKNLNLPELVERFLYSNHNWSYATYSLITYMLNSHLKGKPLPINPTSRAINIKQTFF